MYFLPDTQLPIVIPTCLNNIGGVLSSSGLGKLQFK